MIDIIWLIIVPLLAGFSLFFIDLYLPKLKGIFILSNGLLIFLLSISLLIKLIDHPLIYNLGNWKQGLGISLIVDPLGGLLAVLITFISFIILSYSLSYIQINQLKYYTLLFLLITGMLGMILTGDLFNLYVFFEITSIISYVLVAFNKKDIAFEASFKYMIIGSISGILILLAIILIYQSTGTLNLAQLVITAKDIPLKLKQVIAVLLLIGFGSKFALVPLHTWLPDAHSTAPSSISALLSGVVIKVFLYALLRVLFVIFRVEELLALKLNLVFLYGGVITLLTGHLLAYRQNNLKRLLAYSSIAQIGYILIGIGVFNAAGLEGAIYHIINHAVVKGVLFMTAGILILKTKKKDIADLKGIAYQLPLSSFIFTISALNIVGLPPFNSFISKWILTTAALKAGFIIPAISILIGSLISLSYYLKIIILFYTKVTEKINIISIPYQLQLGPLLLSLSYLPLAFFPDFLLLFIKKAPLFLLKPINYHNILLGGEKWIGLFG
jgi:proton-translocating NADH-quinone oxidoreductase chain N